MRHTRENLKTGFTLIELLVVVSIIGVLASVVLTSLGSARGKASDVKIKSQLNSMRNQAELYSGNGAAFTTGTCVLNGGTIFDTANDGLWNLFNGLTASTTRCGSNLGPPSSGTAWAVAAQTASGAWCVDSTGVARNSTAGGVLYTTDLNTALIGTSCL